MLTLTAKISEHVLCMHHYRTPGEDAGMLASSFFTIQKFTNNVIQVIAFTMSSVVADIVSLGGSLQFQTGLLVSFQCYGTFDAAKWFRIIKDIRLFFSICRDAKNGGWGYSR
jgi:hypothetical protein